MMRPHTLEEFAQQLRINGNYWETEFADEILYLFDLDKEVAQPYSDLCSDLEHYAPGHRGNPSKALEWLGDRSAELGEIHDLFTPDELQGENVPDQIKERFDELKEIEATLTEQGLRGNGSLADAIFDLCERVPPAQEYDL